MSSSFSDTDLLAERLRALTLGRVIAAVVVAILLGTLARRTVDPTTWPLLLAAGVVHLVVQVNLWLARLQRAGLVRFATELALIVDLVAISLLLALTGGTASPFIAVLLTEIVAVTLVFGRWAGMRASLLATIGVVWVVVSGPPSVRLAVDALEQVDPALAFALEPVTRAALLLVTLWFTTLVTGWLSDVTERDLRRRTEDLTMLREVTPDLDPRQGPERVAQALAGLVVDRLGHMAAAVWVPSDDRLVLAASVQAREPRARETEIGLPLDDPLVARTLSTPEVEPVRRDDPRPNGLAELFGRRAPLALVPLHVEDRVVGLLAVEIASRIGRNPTVRVREVRLLRMLAEQSALLIDNARLQAELADLAVTDAVTGLPNHRFLQQRVAEELERVSRRALQGDRRALSMVLFDLDHFKKVNDAYGHPTGDRVLAAVAAAAHRTLRGADVVCRYGGEEFAIVLVDSDASEARLACERVRHSISMLQLTSVNGRPIGPVTASFGIATVVGTTEDRTSVLARADMALYAAKHGGRNRVVHYEDLDNLTPSTVA